MSNKKMPKSARIISIALVMCASQHVLDNFDGFSQFFQLMFGIPWAQVVFYFCKGKRLF